MTSSGLDHSELIIILPVYNRLKITEVFVQNILKQIHQSHFLLVIDDGSTDGTAEMVKTLMPNKSLVLQGNGHLWWGGSLHYAHNWLKENTDLKNKNILIINDDTVFGADFLSSGLEVLNKRENTLLLAQSKSKSNASEIGIGVHVDWKHYTFKPAKLHSDLNCLSTRGLIMTGRSFISLGGFYPKLLPHYLSDYEYTIRAFRKGFKLEVSERFSLVADDQTTGFHHSDQSTLKNYLKSTLSLRSVQNPFFHTTFIILSCPVFYIPKNISKVWYVFLKRISQIMMRKFIHAK